jgi:predicted ATPase
MSSKQLVRPDMSQVEADYRFHHLLVRDAAYLGILKRARASMHERFADWAERVNRERDREVEFEEILGYHLEQAYGYLSELGPLDDNGIELGRRAARNLTSAGNRAFARGDMAAAANLLRRARQLLAEGDPDRLQLLPDLAEAMTEIGEFAWAEVFVEEAATGAQEAADAALAAHATLGRLLVRRFHEDEAWGDAVVPQAEGAIQVFGAIEDHAGLAKAYRLLCLAHGTACRFADFLSAGERDLYHAKLAGDRRAQTRAVTAKAIAAVYGPETVVAAIGHCEEALDLAAPNKRSEGIVLALLAELEALRGNVERGRMLYRRARSTLEDAGAGVHAHSMSSHSGPVELLAGDATAAEEELRRDFDTLTAMGETYFASSIAALLAEALYIQARYDEAEGFTRKSEELAPADDLWTQAVWRSVRAKALARDVGRLPEARRLARDAVDLLNPTDAPLWRADGLRDCAEVLSLAGEHDEARALLTDALALYDQKGASVPAERARAQLAAWRDAAER